MKVKLLYALGREKEAEALLRGLGAVQERDKAAFGLGSALGFSVPAPCENISRESIIKSRKLSDSGAGAMARGDPAGAADSFAAAYEADPGNIGALLSLCAANRKLGKPEAALEYCARAAASALRGCGGGGPAGRAQAAEAFLETGRIHLENGRAAEGAAALEKALKAAPRGWARAAEAGALLNALRR
jgi:tetratricopeptide (TPR) repeat protein